MSIPCDNVNKLHQTLLKIDKALITDPDDVAIYVNLGHFDSVDIIEEGFIDYPEIPNPCGEGTIKGQVYLEKVILVGGVNYSILMFDKTSMSKLYDRDIQYKTAYTIYQILPFGQEVEIDPTQLEANFTIEYKRVQEPDGVDFYLYTVDGTVDLVYNGPLVIVPDEA